MLFGPDLPKSKHREVRMKKRVIAIVLALILVIGLAACGAKSSKMTMGTGGTTGTYYAFGGVLGQYIKNNAGIDVTDVYKRQPWSRTEPGPGSSACR